MGVTNKDKLPADCWCRVCAWYVCGQECNIVVVFCRWHVMLLLLYYYYSTRNSLRCNIVMWPHSWLTSSELDAWIVMPLAFHLAVHGLPWLTTSVWPKTVVLGEGWAWETNCASWMDGRVLDQLGYDLSNGKPPSLACPGVFLLIYS